jgi:hypothetical protein
LIDSVLLDMLQVCDKQDDDHEKRGKMLQGTDDGHTAKKDADLLLTDQLRKGAIAMTQLLAPRAGSMTGWRRERGKSTLSRPSLLPPSSVENGSRDTEGSVREEIAIYIQEQFADFVETINSSALVAQLIEDEFDLMVRAFMDVKTLTDPDDKHYTSQTEEEKKHDPRVVMITFGEVS